MDVSSVSSQKATEATSQAQVTLQKKQTEQAAQVAATLITSAAESTPNPGNGKLLTVA